MNTVRVAPVEVFQPLLSMTFFLRTNGRAEKGDPRGPKNVKKYFQKSRNVFLGTRQCGKSLPSHLQKAVTAFEAVAI